MGILYICLCLRMQYLLSALYRTSLTKTFSQNTMNIRTLLAPLGVALFMLTSCENLFEEDSLKPDGSNPSVVINTPSSNQTINASQGLRVNVTATDKDNIQNISLTVKRSEDDYNLVSFNKIQDKRVVEFDTTVVLSGFTPGTYTLLIDATDKRTNYTLKEVKVTLQ